MLRNVVKLNQAGDEKAFKYFFELGVKKMYFEFTKEAKVGGYSHKVQDGLRLA